MFAVTCCYNKCTKPNAETLGLQGDEVLTLYEEIEALQCVILSEDTAIICVKDIVCKCIYIEVDTYKYVGKMPNTLKID